MVGSKDTIVVVGAGLSGAVLAERYAAKGKKVLVIEKRNHIAGNCYDYVEGQTGILMSKYGAHIFHTSHEDVWKYVNRFGRWVPYEHKVKSFVNGKLVPVPVNIETVNELFGLNIQSEEEMKEWLESETEDFENPKNSEESALNRVGEELYELMFRNYTKKQWDMEPSELEPSVMERIPVRTDHNERYFNDPHEAIPYNGYTEIVRSMLKNPNIELMLNTDFDEITNIQYEKLFFTGPIDGFFDHKYGKLQYRSIRFEDDIRFADDAQDAAVINYPGLEFPFTRIIEHKKLYKKGLPGYTMVTKEYSTWDGPPYYPVPTQENRDKYELYKKEAEELEGDNIYFVGRLANYKYFNMDQAIKNALDLFERLEGAKK